LYSKGWLTIRARVLFTQILSTGKVVPFRTRRMRRNRFVIGGGIGARLTENTEHEDCSICVFDLYSMNETIDSTNSSRVRIFQNKESNEQSYHRVTQSNPLDHLQPDFILSYKRHNKESPLC
jgi:hypothetical protein